MDKLYRLLQEYEGRKLDDDFIENAFSIMMESERDLGHYITDFKMSEIGYGAVAGYSRETGGIIIDNELLKEINGPFTKVVALKIIKQEILRARNLKTAIEGTEEIEPIILRCANKDFLFSQKYIVPLPFEESDPQELLARKTINYETDPDRRIADIRSWRFVVNTLKNKKDGNELPYARDMLFRAYTSGYKSNGYYLEPPTYEFLVNMGFNRELRLIKDRMNYKNYSFATRVELGLPISYKECGRGVRQKTKSKTFVIE